MTKAIPGGGPINKIKDYIWIFAHSVGILILMLTYPFWYLWIHSFDGPFICGTVIDLICILLFILKPVAGIAFVGFIFLICIRWGCIGYKEMLEKEAEFERDKKNKKAHRNTIRNPDLNIFFGLNSEEARRKYRKLMKEFHPDNGGDIDKCRKLNTDYDKYKKKLNI